MTIVEQYGNETDAYIDCSLLQSHGLQARVESDALSLLFPGPAQGMGSVKLLVPDSEAAKAREILSHK